MTAFAIPDASSQTQKEGRGHQGLKNDLVPAR